MVAHILTFIRYLRHTISFDSSSRGDFSRKSHLPPLFPPNLEQLRLCIRTSSRDPRYRQSRLTSPSFAPCYGKARNMYGMQCKQPRAYQRSFGLCSVIDMVSLWGAMWCKKVIRSLKPLGYGRDFVYRSQSHRKLVLSACVSLNLASKNRSFTTRVSIRNVSPSHLIGIFPKSFYPSLLAIRIDSWIS